jgi:hypothetical protein
MARYPARSARTRLGWAAALVAAVIAVAVFATAAPAATTHAPASRTGTALRHGRKPARPQPAGLLRGAPNRTVFLHSADPTGAVGPDPHVILIFWGSGWNTAAGDPRHAKSALINLFDSLVGTQDTWSTILSQYCAGLPVGTTRCGTAGTHIAHLDDDSPLGNEGDVFEDTDSEPGPAPSFYDLGNEAVRAAQREGSDADQASNDSAVCLILTPHGVNPDGLLPGFCGEHDNVPTPANVLLAWAVVPYVPD